MNRFVAFALLIGCGEDRLEWQAKQITAVTLGPFTIHYPEGWRDLRESRNAELVRLGHQAGPNAHIIVPENATNTNTNIAIDWNGPHGNPDVTCADFSRALSIAAPTQFEKIEDVSFNADRGCAWTQRERHGYVHAWTRFRDDHVLVLACIRPLKGSAAGDAACAQVLEAIKAQ